MSEEQNVVKKEEMALVSASPVFDEEVDEEESLVVYFKKPFTYENKVYESVDLSEIENLTGKQLCEIHKRFTATQNFAIAPETSPAFACFTASMVTELPIEFFYALPAKELNKIKRTVSAYFFGED